MIAYERNFKALRIESHLVRSSIIKFLYRHEPIWKSYIKLGDDVHMPSNLFCREVVFLKDLGYVEERVSDSLIRLTAEGKKYFEEQMLAEETAFQSTFMPSAQP